MNWTDLAGKLIGAGAPVIGTALGGPVGGMIGTALGNILAGELGVDATPEAVNAAIDKDPTAAAAALSAADRKAEIEMERLKIAVADTQSARDTTVQFVKAGSALQYGVVVVSVLITLGFLGSLGALLFFKLNFNDTTGQIVLLLVGSLSTMQTQVVNYWLGSSAGSADKSAALQAIASAPPKLSSKIIPFKKSA